METEELLIKMKRVKNNLERVKSNLKSARGILNQSITFNNNGFKENNLKNLDTKLTKQINNLNSKIIPGLNKM